MTQSSLPGDHALRHAHSQATAQGRGTCSAALCYAHVRHLPCLPQPRVASAAARRQLQTPCTRVVQALAAAQVLRHPMGAGGRKRWGCHLIRPKASPRWKRTPHTASANLRPVCIPPATELVQALWGYAVGNLLEGLFRIPLYPHGVGSSAPLQCSPRLHLASSASAWLPQDPLGVGPASHGETGSGPQGGLYHLAQFRLQPHSVSLQPPGPAAPLCSPECRSVAVGSASPARDEVTSPPTTPAMG